MNQELLFEDKKNEELVKALKGYWIDQAHLQHPELYQGEVNPSLAEQEPSKHHRHDKQPMPDAHYFATDGQEAPSSKTGFKAGMVELCHNREVAATVAVFIWVLVVLLIAGQ